MIRSILITALLAFGATAWAAGGENAIEGIWETDTGGYVQIHKEDDAWVGTVVGSMLKWPLSTPISGIQLGRKSLSF